MFGFGRTPPLRDAKKMIAEKLERSKQIYAFKPFDTSEPHFFLPVESELIGWDEAKHCFVLSTKVLEIYGD